jgi:uncharacterized protein
VAERAKGQLHDGFVPGRHLIDAYGAGGFRFADMSHKGSILLLPSGVRAWTVALGEAWRSEQFQPVMDEHAGIELLLVGCGPDIRPLPEALRLRLRELGIGVELMATGPAARTYNILMAEGRKIAAALVAGP